MGDIEKLDMSLEDIIKKSSDKKPKSTAAPSQRTRIQQKRRGGVTVRGRGGRGPKTVGKVAARAPISVAKTGGVGIRGKGVQKPARGRGITVRGRGGLRRGGPAGLRRAVPRDAIIGAAKWSHDMFNQVTPLQVAGAQQRQPQGVTLLISNLNYNVSNDDIKELFSSLGPLVSYGINYDRSGRSDGTAQVVYRHKDHALAAMKRYNNVALDNLKMVISLREPMNQNVLTTLSSGISVTSLGRGGVARGGVVRGGVVRGGVARGGGAGRGNQAPKNVQAIGGRGGAAGRGRRGSRGRGGAGRGQGRGAKGGDGMDIDS